MKLQRIACIAFSSLLFSVSILIAQTKNPSVISIAVLKFTNNTNVFGYDKLELSIPEMLKTELSKYDDLLIVERTHIEKALEEQKLSLSGIVADDSVQEAGRLFGAEYVLRGEISLIDHQQLRLDCHIIKVSSGQVRGEKVIGAKDMALDKMIFLLAGNTYYNLSGRGSYLNSVKLQKYRGLWFLTTAVVTAAGAAYSHIESEKAYDSYLQAVSLRDFDKQYNRANNFRKARNGLLISTGVFALISTSLFLKERGANNKIYAANHAQNPAASWALQMNSGFTMQLAVHF